MQDQSYLGSILKKGAQKANEKAVNLMSTVRDALGFVL
jgi:hypothetical protein